METLREKQAVSFRDYIPPLDSKVRQDLARLGPHEWGEMRAAEPFVKGWMRSWKESYDQPFQGITTTGNVLPNIYRLATENEDCGAPTAAMVAAAECLVDAATPSQRQTLCYPIDAREWRRWINPEIYVFKNGLRLEEASETFVDLVHELLRASLSSSGYAKAAGCMKVNRFLGELLGGVKVLNERSYNIAVFGTPSLHVPWGWHLYGHHVVLNCLVVGTQQVFSPVFMGAEPNVIDVGPERAMPPLFSAQEDAGLALMRSLDDSIRASACIYKQLHDPKMPAWRFHRADQRHLGGAFQDNRVVPYEGVQVASAMTTVQQDAVMRIVRLSLDYLPTRVLETRLAEIRVHWADTWFCWIGGWGDSDAFYYKIHSPVLMLEFDHHSGVFLANRDPLPFHIHTLVRTPNGNDYGQELVRLYLKQKEAAEQVNDRSRSEEMQKGQRRTW